MAVGRVVRFRTNAIRGIAAHSTIDKRCGRYEAAGERTNEAALPWSQSMVSSGLRRG